MSVLFVHFAIVVNVVVNVGAVKCIKVTTCQDIREEDVIDTFHV